MTSPSEPGERDPGHEPALAALVRGELTTAETLRVADHLLGCDACRTDLVDVVAGHAVLTSAASLAPTVSAAVDQPLPPLVTPRRARRQAAGRRRTLVLGAAAAVLVAAGIAAGIVVGVDRASDDGTDLATGPVPQVAGLQPVTGDASGEVRFVRHDASTVVTVVADDLSDAGDGYYQAWLLDPATNKMLPLGVVSGGTAQFSVDNELVAAYHAVDVSLEPDDGDPAHSATSVLRGTY